MTKAGPLFITTELNKILSRIHRRAKQPNSNISHITLNRLAACVVLLIALLFSIPTNAQSSYNVINSSFDFTPIIISEINYAGSYNVQCVGCAYDKWIELYNTTSNIQSLDGYSLRFKNSVEANMNLALDGYTIAPYSYFLISNLRSGMDSMLSTAGIEANLYSGKILSVSNNQTKTVGLSLIKDGAVVDDASISSSALISLEAGVGLNGVKRSLERSGGGWILSKTLYASNNYGSPLGITIPEVSATDQKPVLDLVPVPASSQTASPAVEPIQMQIIAPPINNRVLQQTSETEIMHLSSISQSAILQNQREDSSNSNKLEVSNPEMGILVDQQIKLGYRFKSNAELDFPSVDSLQQLNINKIIYKTSLAATSGNSYNFHMQVWRDVILLICTTFYGLFKQKGLVFGKLNLNGYQVRVTVLSL